jgi:branched-chain amino acid transport system permease protein
MSRIGLVLLGTAVFALVAFPFLASALDAGFFLAFAARVLIYAIAATALNIALGLGGMVSLGHALFLGLGMYSVALPSHFGVSSGWAHLAVAVASCAIVGAVSGWVSLRTRGIAFIMITLAFAQMMYYIFVSLKDYGGDDGLSLPGRSTGFGVDLRGDLAWYYLVLALLAGVLYLLQRLVRSRFGRVIVAIRENETRAAAIGYPVYRYKLLCFVISGAIAGLAGALIANQSVYVSPSLLHWIQSGTLMIMVILGGVGRFWGGPLGAVLLLSLEETLSGSQMLGAYSLYWQLPVGLILLAVVLFAPQGIAGLLSRRRGA